jgi:hypothetical protein
MTPNKDEFSYRGHRRVDKLMVKGEEEEGDDFKSVFSNDSGYSRCRSRDIE